MMRHPTKIALAGFAIALLAVPAQGVAGRSPAGASLSHHHFLHTGSGSTDGPSFHIRGNADIQWRIEFRCPEGNYAMHVNLEILQETVFTHHVPTANWKYDAKVFSFGPPNHHPNGLRWDGVERITHFFSSSADIYRMTFHAAHACHYGMYAHWVN